MLRFGDKTWGAAGETARFGPVLHSWAALRAGFFAENRVWWYAEWGQRGRPEPPYGLPRRRSMVRRIVGFATVLVAGFSLRAGGALAAPPAAKPDSQTIARQIDASLVK